MKTAILVLDLINDIVSFDGKIPTCAAQIVHSALGAKNAYPKLEIL